MDECVRIEALVTRWQRGEEIPAGELGRIEGHCTSCAECAGRFASIIAFVSRDVRGLPLDPSEDPSPSFVDDVMRRVRRKEPVARRPRLAGMIAAAAGVVVLVGIGLFAYRLGSHRVQSEILVHFQLPAPGAASVALVGSFTDWETSKLAMSDSNHDGIWEISVRLKKDSIHTYNFLIDGVRWVPDPGAQSQVDDGFGGQSSVVAL